jgi:hypothetical protein
MSNTWKGPGPAVQHQEYNLNTYIMKNIISHPIFLIGFSILMFVVGFIDAEISNATALHQLHWWGKTAVILFSAPLVYWFFGWLIGIATKD